MHSEERALGMIRHMLEWTIDGKADWAVSPETLRIDQHGDIAWTIQPRLGGPVIITHRVYSLFHSDLTQLAEVAAALCDCAKEVELHSAERAGYEQEIRAVAKSLLRRKSDAGIRLVEVVSEPIPTDYYQDIGTLVTFAWGDGSWANSATLEIGDADDLRREFDDLTAGLSARRRAA